jgi:hypothetical protein
MGEGNRAYGRIVNIVVAAPDCAGIFMLTWESRARSCVRKRREHVTRWLRYWARTVRPEVSHAPAQLAFVILLGVWRDRRLATLSHFDFTISGAID